MEYVCGIRSVETSVNGDTEYTHWNSVALYNYGTMWHRNQTNTHFYRFSLSLNFSNTSRFSAKVKCL